MRKVLLLVFSFMATLPAQTVTVDSCLAQIGDKFTRDSANGVTFDHTYIHSVSPSRQYVLELERAYHVKNAYIMDSLNVYIFDYCNIQGKRLLAKFLPKDSSKNMDFYLGYNGAGWAYWSPDEKEIYLAVEGTTLNEDPNQRYLYLTIKLCKEASILFPNHKDRTLNQINIRPFGQPISLLANGRRLTASSNRNKIHIFTIEKP
jgi:hypothetical protein